jgi:quercetin 2,3-dioxygenase
MIRVRRSEDRGHADHGWLVSHHTFSFSSYQDPAHMGFRALRVLNDDRVVPGQGFGTHPHSDFEIISYVVEGALEHQDSMGNGSVIQAGDVQRMTAGTGVTHSEFNHSKTESVRFLQIWVVPERRGLTPGYEQRRFGDDDKRDRLRLVVSPEGKDGSLRLHQDVSLYASLLGAGKRVRHELNPGRHGWIQVMARHRAMRRCSIFVHWRTASSCCSIWPDRCLSGWPVRLACPAEPVRRSTHATGERCRSSSATSFLGATAR